MRQVKTALAALLLLVVVVVLTQGASRPLDNYDTYFHLRLGHEFLDGAWSLRHPGTVSSSATADWVPTQWLPEVVMARLEDWGGLPAVAWLSGLLQLLLVAAAYWTCRRRAEPLVAAVLVAVALVACTPGLSMRPQLLSYLFVVLTTGAWLRARETGRAPFLLVPLAWVWSMCHGMWPIGIVIGLVAVTGIAAERSHPWRRTARMLAVPVGQAAVTLLTPLGTALFPAVLLVNSRAEYFSEWDPPDFTEPYGVAMLALLALAVVPRLRSAERTAWFDLLLLGLAVLWAVYSTRTVPVAACMTAVLAAAGVQALLDQPRPAVTRPERLLTTAGLVAALVALALVAPRTADRPIASPAWLATRFADAPAGTPVLTSASYGAFVMWRFPQLDVPLHGYGDLYTDEELAANAVVLAGLPDWVERVRETGAEYAVLRPGSTLAYNLRETQGWQVLEHSDDLELLQAPAGWTEGS